MTDFNPGPASTLNEAVKLRYEANADTNAFSDAEQAKLAGIAPGANAYAHPDHSGDVTSTGDGATVIAPGAVSYAKLQDLSAPARLLGRGAAFGAGDCEEITLGDGLTMTGTVLTAAGGGGGIGVLSRHPAVTVAGSTAETEILNVALPGGTLGSEGQLRVMFGGLITNSSGGSGNARFRVYFGATLMWEDVSSNLASSSNGRGLWAVLLLSAQGATSSQDVSGTMMIGGTGSASAGRGDIGSDEISGNAAIDGVAAIDSTVAQSFRVTVQHSSASASFQTARYRCVAELL